MRPFGSKSDGKTLQLVQRGTDKRIPVELVKQPTGEVLDPAELEELSVKVASESEAGCASVPHTIEDKKLVVEVTAEVTRQLGLGVYTLTATGRIPDPAYHDGYHDYEIVADLCKVTKYGSNETPIKVTANVLEGLKGKDAYDDYLETTTDNPKLTREEWSRPRSNNGNAEEGMNKTEIELLYKLNNGTDETAPEATTAGAQLMEADGHRRDIISAMRAKGVSVDDTEGLTDLASKIQEVKVYVLPVYRSRQFGQFKGEYLPTLEVYQEFNPADFTNMFANSTALKALPEIRNAGQISAITNLCSGCMSMTTATPPDLPAVTVANGAFYGCTSLETLTIGAMPRCTTLASLVTTCASLKTLTLGDSPNVADISQIAYGCSSLTEVTIGTGDALTKVDSAFNGCDRLRRINGTLDFTKLAATGNLFFGCDSLEEVRIKGLKVDLSLQQSVNLSTESVKYLVENLQQVTGKSITLARSWQTAHPTEAREYSQKASAKGFTLNFR
nr:MAG TPA: leucine-rich repeat protein [Caudoviricetes sp.]